MSLVIPNQGEQIALEAMVGKMAGQNLKLILFKSNTTPDESTTEADLTEADFTGYAAITLTAASWSFVAGNPSTLSYAEQTFTSTAAQNQTIYGYALIQVTSGLLVWVERFTSPLVILHNLDTIGVIPAITLE